MTRSLQVGARLLPAGLALALAAAFGLTGCTPSTKEAVNQTGEAVRQATKEGAGAMGEAAKTAATTAGQAALAPAVGPVLDLLKKGEADVKAGNIAGAIATMGGFQAIWDKAGPVTSGPPSTRPPRASSAPSAAAPSPTPQPPAPPSPACWAPSRPSSANRTAARGAPAGLSA
jgi:hypothetical protein